MARILGIIEFGKYSFAVNFTLLAGILPDMGLSYLYIREVSRSRKRAEKYMSNFLTIKIMLSAVTFFLIVTAINLLNYPKDTTLAIYGMAIYMILMSFYELFRSSFHAFEKMEYDAVVKLIERFVLFSAGMYVLLAGFGLMGIIAVSVLAAAVGFGLGAFFMLWKFVRPSISLDFEFCKKSIKTAFPFALTVIFALLYFGIDGVMLFVMVGDASVGIYSAAYNLILGVMIIPTAFSAAIYPIMSRYFETSKGSLKFLYEKSIKYLVLLAIPTGFVATILGPKIIDFLYGPEYAASTLALQLLVWGGVAWFVSMGISTTLRSVNRQKTLAWIATSAALLNIVLNLILIPYMSFIGAGIATIITEFFVLFACLYKLSGILPIPRIYKILLKSVFSSIVTVALVYFFIDLHVLLLVAIAFVYFPVLFLLGTFDKSDFELLKEIFQPSQ
jgi:O-antigen/teichoic acid export membrane protein